MFGCGVVEVYGRLLVLRRGLGVSVMRDFVEMLGVWSTSGSASAVCWDVPWSGDRVVCGEVCI